MIPFSKPSMTNLEQQYIAQSLQNTLCGDGAFTHRAVEMLGSRLENPRMLLTTSCTHALEMAALLCDLQPGDEVILPSFTFVSTANAFLLRGAKLVFCDIEPETMNMDVCLLPQLITPKTKVITPVDYAGVPCNMDAIREIADRHTLYVVEDAAQAVGSRYKGKASGCKADFACYSFHATKNYVMGEGGAIAIRDEEHFKRAEIIREKGTDRNQFLRGAVDKYTWCSMGSSYLPADPLAAMLCAQLERFDEIMKKRMNIWNCYHTAFAPLEQTGALRRPVVPDYAEHNAHMYYLILPSSDRRNQFIASLQARQIVAPFHYIPLHSSPMGIRLGAKHSSLPVTEEYADRLVRLPLWTDMEQSAVDQVIDAVWKAVTG